MARTVQNQPPAGRSGGSRSYWVKTLETPGGEAAAPPETEDEAGAPRFVEPFRLDTKQRGSLLALLRKLRVGDTDGREIFLAAISYDLATYKQQAISEPPPVEPPPPEPLAPSPQEPALSPLAASLGALCERIDALDEPTRAWLLEELQKGDRFGRAYDTRYLAELRAELDLLAHACAAPAPLAPAATPPEPQPRLSANARQLLARLADVYADCFENAPTADPEGPFSQILRHLFVLAAIDLPTDEDALTQVLGENQPTAGPAEIAG